MHIRFVSIRIKRFRSFQNESVFEFDPVGSGLYFLKGKNEISQDLGANDVGKSTIIDAFMWCLYGRTVRGLTNAHIVPWKGTGKTEVEIEVEVAGKIKRIQRALNPNLLTVDGIEVGQDYIETLIPIPFSVVPYTIILGQKQPLFFDLKASPKLDIFSDCLNLERWEDRSSHAKNIVSGLELEIQSKEGEIVAFNRLLSSCEDDLEKLKQASKTWEEDRSLKLASAEKDKELVQKQIAAVMPDRDKADLMLERASIELDALEPVLDNLNTEWHDLSRNCMTLEVEQNRLSSDVTSLESSLAYIKDETCPTCNQPLTDKKKLEKDFKVQIKEKKDRLKEIFKELSSYEKHREKLENTINIQEEAKERFGKDEDQAREYLDRVLPQIAAWEAEIKAVNIRLEEKENDNNPYTNQIQIQRKRKSQAEISIEDAQKVVTSKREYCERVRFWIKGFKDIKLLSIEEILQELEIVTNGMLEAFGLAGWKVLYDIEKETKKGTIAKGLNISILSPENKEPVKWEVWGGGVSQRLKLIGSAALSSVLLNHIGITTNLMVLDEPTESLSKEGVRDLVDLLALHAKETKKAVWLVDHHVLESSKFVQTVLVTKNKSGSMLAIV